MSELCVEPLWYGEQPNAIARQLDFCYICFLKFKSLNSLLNSPEYTVTWKGVFLIPCIKILLRHSNRWTQNNHHGPSCMVYAPAEKAKKLLLFLLYPFLLCGLGGTSYNTELVFLNVYGGRESIIRNEFRQPM
jgi:hypothetical protein